MPELSIKPLYSKAYAAYKTHWRFLVPVTLIAAGIQFGLNFLTNQFTQPALTIPSSLISWAINTTVTIGLINIYLKLVDTNTADYPDLYQKFALVGKMLLTSLIYGFIIFLGLIFFIVPGIILSLKYMFYSYYIVDQNLSPIDSLKQSSSLTKGHKSKLFLLALSLFVFNLLGALPALVGLLFTLPISMLIMANTYRELNPKKLATSTAPA